MKKIFCSLAVILTLLTATAFAAENSNAENAEKGVEYTSKTYGFKIVCPSEFKVVVNPFENPQKKGELLVFANDGIKILYGYQILLDAFDSKSAPDFNKADQKTLDAYLEKLKVDGAYEFAKIEKISKDNNAVFAVTAKEIEVKDDNGEVEGVLEATSQNALAFFRTKSGRCVSIQLIVENLDAEMMSNFKKSVATYVDATDISMTDKKGTKKDKK